MILHKQENERDTHSYSSFLRIKYDKSIYMIVQ